MTSEQTEPDENSESEIEYEVEVTYDQHAGIVKRHKVKKDYTLKDLRAGICFCYPWSAIESLKKEIYLIMSQYIDGDKADTHRTEIMDSHGSIYSVRGSISVRKMTLQEFEDQTSERKNA